MARPGVHAVGVGLKERGGVLTNELVIVCFVEKKHSLAKLNPDDVIPPLLDGIPTDVQQAGVFKPCSDPNFLQQQVRPLAGGLQLQVGDFFGTLGFMGRLVSDSTIVGVSNEHVLAPKDTTDFQPTNAKHNDVGTTANVVLSTKVDAGYIRLTTTSVPSVYRWNGTEYFQVPIDGAVIVTTSQLPYLVWKTGRTTGTTFGRITSMFVTGIRADDQPFENQFTITPLPNSGPFAAKGDSGSAVVSFLVTRIAALFWGVDRATGMLGIASPIAAVLEALGIEVASAQTQHLQEPVVVPPAQELLARLKSDQGRRIASFLSEYGPEVRDLIYTDRRVLETWTRHHGHEICNAIIENVALKSTPLPATMAGAPTKPALEEFGGVLIERGSPALGSAIEAVRADIEWLIDRPYADAASGS